MGEGSAIALVANQYDIASKRIVNSDPALFGRIFGIDVPSGAESGPTELNLAEVHADRRNADLVLTSGDRVIHLEFQRRADPTMADRMLIYRSLLRVEPACAGKRIQQHVIVLGQGTSPSRIDEPPDLLFMFETHYARDVDPVQALTDPLTAPWAMLAAAPDGEALMARLAEAINAAMSAGSKSLVRDLINTTLAFAAIAMKREDIQRALREAEMPSDISGDLVWADELVAEHVLRLLAHRGVDPDQARSITDALIRSNPETSVERAAFDDLAQLTALAE
jgi:hypothetical protein